MAKKPTPSTALAVVTQEPKNLTVRSKTEVQAYMDSSSLIDKAYDEAMRSGVPFIKARLCLGYLLSQIRATDRGALKNYYKLAATGTGGIKRKSRATLERSLQMWDRFAEDIGIKKKEMGLLEDKHHLSTLELDLWTQEPPKDADELLQRMHAWAVEKGMRIAEEEVMAKPTPPPAGGGDDPAPSDPTQLAEQEAAEFLERMIAHFETDLHAQLPTGDFLNHEDKKLAGHPCTWSLLSAKDLSRLHKIVERWQASTTRLIKLKGKR